MATVWITFTRPGFHNWPDARTILPERGYLSSRHRHLFHVKITAPVTHDDRDIEFHDLRDYAESWWPADGEMGSASCEHIAHALAVHVLTRWHNVAWIEVSVSEDGECGATVRTTGESSVRDQ